MFARLLEGIVEREGQRKLEVTSTASQGSSRPRR